jgi:hypothetical protein
VASWASVVVEHELIGALERVDNVHELPFAGVDVPTEQQILVPVSMVDPLNHCLRDDRVIPHDEPRVLIEADRSTVNHVSNLCSNSR